MPRGTPTHTRRRVLAGAGALAVGLSGCTSQGSDCEQPTSMTLEEVGPPPDIRDDIVPVVYEDVSAGLQSLFDEAMGQEQEGCYTTDPNYRELVVRVQHVLEQQPSLRGGARDGYLRKSGDFYDIRLRYDGELISA